MSYRISFQSAVLYTYDAITIYLCQSRGNDFDLTVRSSVANFVNKYFENE